MNEIFLALTTDEDVSNEFKLYLKKFIPEIKIELLASSQYLLASALRNFFELIYGITIILSPRKFELWKNQNGVINKILEIDSEFTNPNILLIQSVIGVIEYLKEPF